LGGACRGSVDQPIHEKNAAVPISGTGRTMSVPTDAPATPVLVLPAIREEARCTADGIIGGLLGAATIAVWFLLVDAINGRPLYTPTLLGTALFRYGNGGPALDTLPLSVEMVLMYTAVHALIFAALGGLASRLLAIAERYPEVGFGILVLFVVFEFAVTVSPILFAAPVVRALTWPAILVANLLATAAMAGYLWHRHPGLRVNP